MIPQLVAIEQDPEIEGLIVILNTVGGDVEAGLAIAELISTMETPVVSLVLGGGHSIGVPLACSAKYSFIAPSATMTVHPVRMSGLVLGVPQTLSYFDKMQERDVYKRQSTRLSWNFSPSLPVRGCRTSPGSWRRGMNGFFWPPALISTKGFRLS